MSSSPTIKLVATAALTAGSLRIILCDFTAHYDMQLQWFPLEFLAAEQQCSAVYVLHKLGDAATVRPRIYCFEVGPSQHHQILEHFQLLSSPTVGCSQVEAGGWTESKTISMNLYASSWSFGVIQNQNTSCSSRFSELHTRRLLGSETHESTHT